METLFQTYVLNGGPLMVPLLLCSLWLLAIVIRDMFRFKSDRMIPADLLRQASNWNDATAGSDVERALGRDASPIGRVLTESIERRRERVAHGETGVLLSEIVEDATARVADDLYEDLGPLSTIYTVAPLLGLLGTILGMMSAFREYARVEQRDLSVLSRGIQEALVTTLWGLAISILAYIAARYFEGRIRRYENDLLPPAALKMLEKLYPAGGPARSAAMAPASAPPVQKSEKAAPGPETPPPAPSANVDTADTAVSAPSVNGGPRNEADSKATPAEPAAPVAAPGAPKNKAGEKNQ